MNDLISRQMLLEYIHGEPVGRLLCDKYNLDGLIKQFPSARPEKRTEERTEKHACDCISRRAAIDALEKIDCSDGVGISLLKCDAVDDAVTAIKALPSAQPEIIRCRECKHYYFADNRIPQEQRYVCDIGGEVWQPDDYCSFAERREVSETDG